MVSLVAIIIWHIPLPIVLLGFLVFGLLDGLYLSSALTKVPDGAWFTLALAVLLCSVFILWRYGKENQWRAEAADRLSTSHLFAKKDHGKCFQEPIFLISSSMHQISKQNGDAKEIIQGRVST